MPYHFRVAFAAEIGEWCIPAFISKCVVVSSRVDTPGEALTAVVGPWQVTYTSVTNGRNNSMDAGRVLGQHRMQEVRKQIVEQGLVVPFFLAHGHVPERVPLYGAGMGNLVSQPGAGK